MGLRQICYKAGEKEKGVGRCLRFSHACYLLHADFMVGLLFGLEDGGDIFHRRLIFTTPNGVHSVEEAGVCHVTY
jgi:hypothetical protein